MLEISKNLNLIFMAKGIVVKKPSGPDPYGRIMVSDPTDSSGHGITIVSEIGSIVTYTETNNSAEGDVVDFNYDGKEASGLTTSIKGTVISGTYQPDITVKAGESVLLSGAVLNGVLITVNGGILTVINNTVIKGRIVSTVDGSFIAISDGTAMNGNFEISGASTFSLKNSTSQGSLVSTGSDYAAVTGCTIKGKLEVLNAKVCKCSGNTVSGDINTPGCTS